MKPSSIETKISKNITEEDENASLSAVGSNNNNINSSPRAVNVHVEDLYRIFQQGQLEVVALKGVNLKIYAGEIVIIMGPSGSGKTTLLNCMSGLDRPSAGNIFIRGFDIAKMNDLGVQKVLQNEIGIVFQFFNLVPSLTAAGNIELPMNIADKPELYRKERVKNLLDLVGLEDRSHHRPFTLSGGERQRVAIAMAFANDPRVILADEPTGNIDSITSDKIMQIFANFREQYPEKSVVIVTHNPALRKIADRTFIIKDGQIIRELGRVDPKGETFASEPQSSGTETQVVHDILTGRSSKDEVEEILNPINRFLEFGKIEKCRYCESPQIQKKIDHQQGSFRMENGHLITRAAIYCEQCHQFYFETVSVKEMELNL
ncbi:MAG: ABC transporter ATP-binding protein [Promethearchaeota archaeon]|nr:MAG: ABC transporter ATP-binding protein [Candidatus Lokiarchaeota archaeon]